MKVQNIINKMDELKSDIELNRLKFQNKKISLKQEMISKIAFRKDISSIDIERDLQLKED